MTDESSLGPRQMNRLRIIEALYRHPLSSRADLARETMLSRATVSTLVEELVQAGLVEENAAAPADLLHAMRQAGKRAQGLLQAHAVPCQIAESGDGAGRVLRIVQTAQ